MKKKITNLFIALIISLSGLMAPLISNTTAYAESQSMIMSPMNQRIVITPADSYQSSFTISNPGTATSPIDYSLEIAPFYVDEKYNSIFDQPGTYSEITEWITIDSPLTGTLNPNQYAEINFTINTPSNAPSGGQYAAIIASITNAEDANGTSIKEKQAIAHIIFAEVTGETHKQGEITEASVPSFLFDGKLTASSTIKNTGNVHGIATYTLKITPAFGGDDVYNNEEDPEVRTIVPDRTFYNELTWEGTPSMGLFNVKYTVSFEGVTTEVSKLVIICPIWLLFVIAFIIVGIIIGLIAMFRRRR